jgi:hypothetical protein
VNERKDARTGRAFNFCSFLSKDFGLRPKSSLTRGVEARSGIELHEGKNLLFRPQPKLPIGGTLCTTAARQRIGVSRHA